jgi:hypothetical protein
LLNVRSRKGQKFAEITALVPFSTATPVCDSYTRTALRDAKEEPPKHRAACLL